MSVRSDFLERSVPNETVITPDLSETNKILRALLAEMRKDVPKVGCEIVVVNGAILNGEMGVSDIQPAEVRFRYQGNSVKSMYTVVYNGSADDCYIGINRPVVETAAAGNGTGFKLTSNGDPATGMIVLPDVEIEWLSIVLVNGAGESVGINTGKPDAALGSISIYGWTLREYANITE